MSGSPEIDAEIKKLTTLSIWPRGKLAQVVPDPYYLDQLPPETQEMITAHFAVKQAKVDFETAMELDSAITSETLRQSRHYSHSLTFPGHREKAEKLAIYQINALDQEADLRINDRREALQMRLASISPETKQRVLNTQDKSIHFRRYGQSWGSSPIYGEDEWDKHQKETLEGNQVIELGNLCDEKLKVIYHDIIKDREAQRPDVEKRIKAARKLCAEAEKVIVKIREADATVSLSNFKETKAIKEFVKSWEQLSKLRTEFSTLRGSGIEFSDFGKPEPIFPSTIGLIVTESDADRKGKIFQIFKSQMEK